MHAVPDNQFDSKVELRRYEALLQMADLMVRHGSLGELFRELAQRLRSLTSFEIVTLSIHDPAHHVMVMHLFEGADFVEVQEAVPVEESPSGWVWKNQRPLVIRDLHAETRFPRITEEVRKKGIRSSCILPLTTAQRRLGGMCFGSDKIGAYGEADVRFLQRVAEMVALAVENALVREALNQEKVRLQALLEVNAALLSGSALSEAFPAIAGFIRGAVPHDFASIALLDETSQSLRPVVQDWTEPQADSTAKPELPLRGSAPGLALLTREAKVFSAEELAEFHNACSDQLLGLGVRWGCCLPLLTHKGPLGVLNLASRATDAFSPQDVTLLKQVAAQVAIAIDNAQAYQEIAQLKDKLAEEKKYLQGEIRSQLNFEEIIGENAALGHVLDQAKVVAPSDATVLVLGETGTGKELIARAIHRMSSRKDASFIKLNCAAIPTGLLESELFGHEKGAFTGAISQKIGRMELADKGTLFLDEVGDIPSSCSRNCYVFCRIRSLKGWEAIALSRSTYV